MKHATDNLRVFSVANKHNGEWIVEADWHGERRIVHSGQNLFAVIRWAREHGW